MYTKTDWHLEPDDYVDAGITDFNKEDICHEFHTFKLWSGSHAITIFVDTVDEMRNIARRIKDAIEEWEVKHNGNKY